MALSLHCKSWDKSGKSEFVKHCKSLVEKSGSWNHAPKSVKRSIYDLCCHVIDGALKPDQALVVLHEVAEFIPDLCSLVADTLSIIDIETSVSEDKEKRDRFTSFVSACDVLVPISVFKERLDQDLLETTGFIASKQIFQQKYVKTKTRLFYKQQKFNLLREESEGYAKLVTELNQELTEKTTYQQVLQNIKSLIGCFDLDPNRVLDVLLESYERRPEADTFYTPLFREYVTEQKTLCHILGFKFHFFEEEETPQSLYRVAGSLLQNNLIDLDSLYPHLWPPDSKIREYHSKDMEEAKVYARKTVVVSLGDKSDEKKEKEEDNVIIDKHAANQKLGLVEALLHLGAWKNAKEVMDRMPEFFATTQKKIALTLCNLVHYMMEPVYRANSGLPGKIMKSKYSSVQSLGTKVTQVSTFRDLHVNVLPILRYLGPYAAWDPILFVKLIRMGKTFMSKRHNGGLSPEDEVLYFGFLNILDEVLLPGMVLLPCNCCTSEELWTFLKSFPYHLRYRLYGNWKNDSYNHHPKLIKAKTDCMERAKYIMKRLAKENVKPSGRQLGKLCHSNPGIVFEYVLSQIQKFDNFIGPVVDSLKFLTSLSYDVLAYCIIEAVANPEKDKMKYDDTNISLWLQSLANFAGSICRKYSIELGGLMQFVANQLKAGKSIDLLLLREIVQKMAGIEISEEVTQDQLEAMAGGELLRMEGGNFAQVRNTKKSSSRLKDTLLENDLALSLGLLIGQQRDGVIFHEGAATHLKLIGKLYDQCQDTLVQFGSFLAVQLSSEDFMKRVPSVDNLIMSYHIPADAAFFLCRPAYTYAINSKFDELRKIDKSNKQSSSQLKLQRYIEASEHVMSPITEQVRPLYSPKVWDDLSAPFFVTFWSLSMYDLAVPSNVYEKQVQQLQTQVNAVEDNRDMPQSKKKKEKERLTSLMDKLKDEEKKQGDHVNRVLNRLKKQKELWFVSRSTKNETITQFLQLCVFPRCCFTANDALYCSKFIRVLHDLQTPNFSTLICYDRIFCDVTYTVTSCTENEAHRYGRFLCAALETIMRWHSAKAIYEKECACYPGFVTVFRKGSDSNNKADQLDYENYRHVCHKWHFRITKAMVACLESGKYIQIRNSLIILTKILTYYPRILQFGQALERRVDRLREVEKDKRPDIFALAMGYSGQLKSKKTTWIHETEFHQKDKEKAEAKKAAQAAAAAEAASNKDGDKKEGKDSKKTNGEAKSQSKKSENGKGKETKDTKEKKSSDKKDKGDGKEKLEAKVKDGKKSSEEKKEARVKENGKTKEDRIMKDKPTADDRPGKENSKVKNGEGKEEKVARDGKIKEIKVKDEKKSKEEKIKSREEKIKIKEEKVKVKEEIKEKVKVKEEGKDKSKVREEPREKTIKREDKVKIKRSHSPPPEKTKRSYSPVAVRRSHSPPVEKSRRSYSPGHEKSRRMSPDQEKEYLNAIREKQKEMKEREANLKEMRERRFNDDHHDRASSIASNDSGSLSRQSPEISPRNEERDVKRRRVESSATQSSSKVSMMEVCS